MSFINKDEKTFIKQRTKVEKWLKKNKGFLNISAFEKELGLPKGHIQKFLKYDKKLHDNHILPISEVIKKVTKFSQK